MSKQIGELDIVSSKELLGVRAPIFVALHIDDLGGQISTGVGVTDQRLVEVFLARGTRARTTPIGT